MENQQIDFKLNFLGLFVFDFEKSYDFYSKVLGIETKHSKHGWAAFKTSGMKFELFSGGKEPSLSRTWGNGVTMRPSFQIENLEVTVGYLQSKGVPLVNDIQKASWGEWIEFIAPEGIHWILAHSPNSPFSQSLQNPHIGGVELKAHSFGEQQAFYRKLMGNPKHGLGNTGVVFRQEKDSPVLVLEPGGQTVSRGNTDPFFISFEVSDIHAASKWLKTQNINIVTDLTEHSWGADLYILDADKNKIQIVEYSKK